MFNKYSQNEKAIIKMKINSSNYMECIVSFGNPLFRGRTFCFIALCDTKKAPLILRKCLLFFCLDDIVTETLNHTRQAFYTG